MEKRIIAVTVDQGDDDEDDDGDENENDTNVDRFVNKDEETRREDHNPTRMEFETRRGPLSHPPPPPSAAAAAAVPPTLSWLYHHTNHDDNNDDGDGDEKKMSEYHQRHRDHANDVNLNAKYKNGRDDAIHRHHDDDDDGEFLTGSMRAFESDLDALFAQSIEREDDSNMQDLLERAKRQLAATAAAATAASTSASISTMSSSPRRYYPPPPSEQQRYYDNPSKSPQQRYYATTANNQYDPDSIGRNRGGAVDTATKDHGVMGDACAHYDSTSATNNSNRHHRHPDKDANTNDYSQLRQQQDQSATYYPNSDGHNNNQSDIIQDRDSRHCSPAPPQHRGGSSTDTQPRYHHDGEDHRRCNKYTPTSGKPYSSSTPTRTTAPHRHPSFSPPPSRTHNNNINHTTALSSFREEDNAFASPPLRVNTTRTTSTSTTLTPRNQSTVAATPTDRTTRGRYYDVGDSNSSEVNGSRNRANATGAIPPSTQQTDTAKTNATNTSKDTNESTMTPEVQEPAPVQTPAPFNLFSPTMSSVGGGGLTPTPRAAATSKTTTTAKMPFSSTSSSSTTRRPTSSYMHRYHAAASASTSTTTNAGLRSDSVPRHKLRFSSTEKKYTTTEDTTTTAANPRNEPHDEPDFHTTTSTMSTGTGFSSVNNNGGSNRNSAMFSPQQEKKSSRTSNTSTFSPKVPPAGSSSYSCHEHEIPREQSSAESQIKFGRERAHDTTNGTDLNGSGFLSSNTTPPRSGNPTPGHANRNGMFSCGEDHGDTTGNRISNSSRRKCNWYNDTVVPNNNGDDQSTASTTSVTVLKGILYTVHETIHRQEDRINELERENEDLKNELQQKKERFTNLLLQRRQQQQYQDWNSSRSVMTEPSPAQPPPPSPPGTQRHPFRHYDDADIRNNDPRNDETTSSEFQPTRDASSYGSTRRRSDTSNDQPAPSSPPNAAHHHHHHAFTEYDDQHDKHNYRSHDEMPSEFQQPDTRNVSSYETTTSRRSDASNDSPSRRYIQRDATTASGCTSHRSRSRHASAASAASSLLYKMPSRSTTRSHDSINGTSPGAKFVAEFARLIDFDPVYYEPLTKIMDEHFQKEILSSIRSRDGWKDDDVNDRYHDYDHHDLYHPHHPHR